MEAVYPFPASRGEVKTAYTFGKFLLPAGEGQDEGELIRNPSPLAPLPEGRGEISLFS